MESLLASHQPLTLETFMRRSTWLLPLVILAVLSSQALAQRKPLADLLTVDVRRAVASYLTDGGRRVAEEMRPLVILDPAGILYTHSGTTYTVTWTVEERRQLSDAEKSRVTDTLKEALRQVFTTEGLAKVDPKSDNLKFTVHFTPSAPAEKQSSQATLPQFSLRCVTTYTMVPLDCGACYACPPYWGACWYYSVGFVAEQKWVLVEEPASRLSAAVHSSSAARGPQAINLAGKTIADAPILYSRGYGLYWTGEYRRALVYLRAAAALDPADARYLYYEGLAEWNLGETEKARQTLARAVQVQRQGKMGPDVIEAALERLQGPIRSQLRDAMRLAAR
jgi:hypothetical protein